MWWRKSEGTFPESGNLIFFDLGLSTRKENNGNFKNAAILPSKVACRWQACALILPLYQGTMSAGAHAQ